MLRPSLTPRHPRPVSLVATGMRSSVRQKLIRVVLGILMLLGVGTLAAVFWLEYRSAQETLAVVQSQIERSLLDKGSLLTANHALILKNLVADNALSDVGDLVARTVAEDEDIVYGLFLSQDEQVPWAYVSPNFRADQNLPDAWHELQLSALELKVDQLTQRETVLFSQRIVEFVAPVIAGTERLGTIRYGVSRARVSAALALASERGSERWRQAVTWLILVVAGNVVLGLVLTLRAASHITAPLAALTRTVNEIAGGNLRVRADINSGDEVEVLSQAFNGMLTEVDKSFRLEQELQIGARVQTALLPRSIEVPGLEATARMVPATEVGGDYYDAIPVQGGAWIGFGDVAGHGLTSGLIMLMLQSAVSAMGRHEPMAKPSDLIVDINRALFENIHHRLETAQHVTFTLIRYFEDGRLIHAGAHEEILILRKRTNKCERLPTPGPWLGAMPDISRSVVDTEVQLEPGDVILLYTDGIPEARNSEREQFGVERLIELLEKHSTAPVAGICGKIFEAVDKWTQFQDDDRTILIFRYRRQSEARS
ncbi:MAG: hypothetical protein RJA70_3372 [Pseudomonadota bacterium]|jgi:serine phosphatase RsbU (regulator of sigma subunit)